MTQSAYSRPRMLNFKSWLYHLIWRRKWQPTPVLLPGNFHGCRSLVGYSSWGRKVLDTTEQLHFLSFCSFFWRRNWQPTPVFLPGEHWGLVGYSLWGCKGLDTTKQLTHTHTYTHTHTTHTHTTYLTISKLDTLFFHFLIWVYSCLLCSVILNVKYGNMCKMLRTVTGIETVIMLPCELSIMP